MADVEQDEAQSQLNVADEAIRRARVEEISYEELLEVLAVSRVVVPVATVPTERWHPATVTTRDKMFLVVAFTQTHLAAAYCKGNLEYPTAMLFDLRWVIESIPPSHGILFNIGGDNLFEWEAEMVTEYRSRLQATQAS